MRLLLKIFAHNWIAILYINFRMLPLAQAVRLPIDIYYGIRFESLAGSIRIDSERIWRGMIKIGGRGSDMFTRASSIIDLHGEIVFRGVCEIGHGCLLRVEKGALLRLGNNSRIGAMSKIVCARSICIGSEVDFSWECQIFDTNFHFIRNTITGRIEPRDKGIEIGDFNWIGNRVTVMKGVKTPNYMTVASNSLCNKDYSGFDSNTVIGGVPAEIIASGKQRIFEHVEDVHGLSTGSGE